MTLPAIDWLPLVPTLLACFTAFVVLVADLFMEGSDRRGLAWIGIAGLATVAVASAMLWENEAITAFAGGYRLDRFALFFNVLFALAGILTLLTSIDYLEATDIRTGDYYTLILFATAGMCMMAAATDLIVIFLGLEVMSVAVYCLSGIWRRNLRAIEAAMKYFVLGAFATGFLLFGIALLYGAFGTTALAPMAAAVAGAAPAQQGLALIGLALLLVGFGFKIAAVPFHAWAPDVYEGAPTTITGFMAVGVKAAAFAALARVFLDQLDGLAVAWTGVLWMLAALTMTVGNVLAVTQTNIKRMLAYSSIAHAGYAMVGVVAGGDAAGSALLYYLLVYGLMNLGAFAVVASLGRYGEPNEHLDDYAGVGFQHPGLGVAMTVFMLSLAGMPPFAGFTGKFYLFSAAVHSGYTGLAILGVLNSVVSMYYYAGVLVRMYMYESTKAVPGTVQRPHLFATVLISGVGTVVLGVFPAWLFTLAETAFTSLH